MGFILLNAMAGIHHPFGENGKGQVDFFLIGLLFKDRFDTIKGKSKLSVIFGDIGTKKFVSCVDLCDACQS